MWHIIESTKYVRIIRVTFQGLFLRVFILFNISTIIDPLEVSYARVILRMTCFKASKQNKLMSPKHDCYYAKS